MAFVIHWITGPAEGEERTTTRVEGEELRIGRGTNADLRFDDASVALEHAVIARADAGWLLADRGSITGTYVGGKPVSEWRLADGDAVDVGPFRLRLRIAGPDAPLEIEVRREGEGAAAPAGAAAAAEPARVDYVAAYRLRHGLLAKPWLALALTALAAAVPLALARAGRTKVFQPGEVTPAHAAQPRIAAEGCAACHTPWLGPTDERCQTCHRPVGPAAGQPGGSGRAAAVHQPRQTTAPPCDSCHVEHRGLAALRAVADARCVACHGDLAVSGGAPAFAAHVHSFASDHPDFSVTLASAGAPRRLPLAVAVSEGADPARIKFGHQLHLRPGLRRLPAGKAQLACADCHVSQEEGTGMRPVAYGTACAGCHPLTFPGARRPADVAPHDTPQRVHEFLAAYYSDRRDPSLSVMEQRRTVLRRLEPERQLDLGEAATRRIAEAEVYLYRTACAECHEVDPDARPLPRVAPTAIAAVWLPHARFLHSKHAAVPCATCHAGAAESARTADVLLPGIAVCRTCHGGGGALPGVEPAAGPTDCVSCHGYHGRAPTWIAAR